MTISGRRGCLLAALVLLSSISASHLHAADIREERDAAPEPVAVEMVHSDARAGMGY